MKTPGKLAATVAMAAIVLSGLAVAQSAQAAVAPGALTITPTSGTISTDPFLASVAVDQACPAGFQDASITSVVQGTINYNISNVRSPAQSNPGNAYGQWGFGSQPISIDRVQSATNNYVSNDTLSAANLADGNFELRVYCFADRNIVNGAKATSPWFSLTLTKTGNNWSVPVAATPTTVSLTAATNANAGQVALSASVKNAAGTTVLTSVVGNIVFKEGATTVATVPVASGTASALLTGVADGIHNYTAEFQSGDAIFSGSTSGGASVTLGAAGTGTTNIQVAIPAGVGTLTLTGVSNTVNLGTATLGAGTLNASGTLNAVVTDTRQLEYPAWSLTGQVGNFTAGAKTLDGKYLGWTPAVAGDATNSVAGAVVLPGTTGLKTSSVLASGSPFAAGTITNASALLQLKAPSNTPAGAYSATLTLTLI